MGDKKPERVGALKEGRYVVIDNEPCKIEKIQTSAPGKHGSAKSRIDARGVFDNKRRSIVKPVDAKIDVPIIDKKSGMITAIIGDTLQLMDMETYETFELPVPEEVEGEIREGVNVEYWETMGRIKIVRVKE
ncbi:MAG: translation initiation factor IF-5A [Methanomicrobia archaeon]|nr:translation initiation factor IF-5A [Methanomicrobia archaeon]HDM22531.1 translation initiation factor IF-5A [Methanomicrobia archaeon]